MLDQNISSSGIVAPRIGILGHHDTHNFGDVLLAELCADAVGDGGGRPDFLFGCGESETSGLARKLRGLRRSLDCAGLVLAGGGYLEAPGRTAFSNLLPLSLAVASVRARRRPVGIFGAGSGVHNGKLAKIMLRYVCAAAAPVVIRDRQSIDCLRIAGVQGDLSLSRDLAHAVSVKGRYKTLFDAAAPSAEKTLLLHIDNLVLLREGHPELAFMMDALRTLKLPQGWRLKILFDYVRDELLSADLGRAVGCSVVSGANVAAVLQEIGNAAVVVSGKFHVALVALSLGKPTLGISPHAKVVDLFNSLGISELHRPILSSAADALELLAGAVAAQLPPRFEEARLSAVGEAAALYDQITQFSTHCCSQHLNTSCSQ
jgi:polysaccharide pyruvyl transferase WcaK-like protein